MVHEEALGATLVEIGASLPEERVYAELEVELLRSKLRRVLGERGLAPVAFTLALALAGFTTFRIVRAITVVVVPAFVRKVAKELPRLRPD